MNKALCLPAMFFLCACAASEEDERLDAIDDFIQVSELEEVGAIRTVDRLDQDVLNDRYVIVTTRKERFLLAYFSPCPELYDQTRRPDVRRYPHAIYAGSDTFRGCRIKAIYSINAGQVAELEEMGRLPAEP